MTRNGLLRYLSQLISACLTYTKTRTVHAAALILAGLLVASTAVFAQNTFPSSGDVGIGTTSPSTLLDVKGGVTGALVTIGNSTNSIEMNANQIYSEGGALYLNYSVGQNTLLNTTSGSVGIGTSSPANLLDLGSGGGLHITSGVPGSTSMALYNNSGTLTWNGTALATGSSVSGTANYIPYFTGSSSLGNSQLYQSGSDIGIGTTTPANLLDIGTGGGIHITSGTPGSTSDALYNNSNVLMWNGSPISGVISSGGRLLCGGANCSNSTGSTTLDYCPYKGNLKTTAAYGNYTIPSGCLTASLTSMYVGGSVGAAADSTLYYVYLISVSGTAYLDLETTGHATDSTTGIEIESGNNANTLVGMIHTNASGTVMSGGETNTPGDTNTVATWDNRLSTTTVCYGGTKTITATTETEIDSTDRCYFMNWEDAAQFSSQQSALANGGQINLTVDVYLDSNGGQLVSNDTLCLTAANENSLAFAPAAFTPSTEGNHFTVLTAAVLSSQSAIFNGTLRSTILTLQ